MPPAKSRPPSASIEVKLLDGIIHARYAGAMTMALVQEAASRIRALLPGKGQARVLYDTREMMEPARELALWMHNFDQQIDR